MTPERRADTVRLLNVLADAWLLEPDAALLQRLRLLEPMAGSLADVDEQKAAVDYSLLFLQLVPPYASLYLSDDGMLNADAAEEAQRTYSRAGFEVQTSWRSGAADHMGVELHFLASLLNADSPQAGRFLTDSLLTWAPVCCLAVERAQVSPLYSALARLTCDGLMALDDERQP